MCSAAILRAGRWSTCGFGAIDGDPGIRPEWHQWVSSAPAWDPMPDDGLPRFSESRRR